MITWTEIIKFEQKMLLDHRLKRGVDYVVTLKYGHAHLLCDYVYHGLLAAGGLKFATIHTY